MHRPRRQPRVPRAAAPGVAALAGASLLLGACGGAQPVTPRTTTITVTPPGSAATATPSTPSTPAAPSSSAAVGSRPPTTYDEAVQHLATGKVDAAGKPVFTSPTGNIFCSIEVGGAVPPGCELRDGRVTPPPGTCGPAGGGGAKDVGRIEWSGDTPKPVCNTDTMFQPGVQVLQYGLIATVPGSPVQCLSESIGMTCVNTTARTGFFIAKGVYQIF